MRPLSAAQIIQVWEIGQRQHWLDRALTLLAIALPDQRLEDLSHLSIGQRDALLLTLRELTFGARLEGVAACPQCQERLEFALNVADIRVVEPSLTPVPTQTLQMEGFEVQFALPSSHDLAAAIAATSPGTTISADLGMTRHWLTHHCLRQMSREGSAIAPTDLPETLLMQISERIAAADPQAEVLLDLTCPACGHVWQVLFDIVTFLWAELSAQAQRLLREIHILARFYGWREADILAMSNMRRQAYLERVGEGG